MIKRSKALTMIAIYVQEYIDSIFGAPQKASQAEGPPGPNALTTTHPNLATFDSLSFFFQDKHVDCT